jgi:hypothetical protein
LDKTDLKYISWADTRSKGEEEIKVLQMIEMLRTRMSYLILEAVKKFNSQAETIVRPEELQQYQLRNKDINKII